MATTPEGRVSAALRQSVINAGGEIRKVQWQGRVGAPDWLVMYKGSAVFVEAKSPGEVPRRSQIVEFLRVSRASGIPVLVLDRAANAGVAVQALQALSAGDVDEYKRLCNIHGFLRYTGVTLCG